MRPQIQCNVYSVLICHVIFVPIVIIVRFWLLINVSVVPVDPMKDEDMFRSC